MTIKSPRRWRRLIVLRGSSRSLKNWSIETTSSELTLRILRSPWPTNQVNWKAIGLPLIQLPRYPKFPKVRVSPAQEIGQRRRVIPRVRDVQLTRRVREPCHDQETRHRGPLDLFLSRRHVLGQ